MDNHSQEELVSKLEKALSEQANRAAEGHKVVADKVQAVKAALDGVLEKITAERVSASTLADSSKERLDELKAMVLQRPDVDPEKMARLERALTERNEELKAAKDRANHLDKALSSKSEELERLAGELEAAKGAADKSVAEAREASARLSTLENEIQDRDHRSAEAEKRAEQLEHDLEASKRESAEAREHASTLERDLAEAQRTADSAAERLRTLEGELAAARESEEPLKQRLAALESEASDKNRSMESASARVEELERREMTLRSELDSLRAEAAHATQGDAAQRLEESETSNQQLREALGQRDRELEEARGELEPLRQRLNELEKQLADAAAAGEVSAPIEPGQLDKITVELDHERKKRIEAEAEVVSLRKLIRDESPAAPKATETLFGSPKPAGESRPRRGSDRDDMRRRMGDILVDAGVITQDQLEEALADQRMSPHKRLGNILVDRGFTTEDVVAQALAFQRNVEFIRIRESTIDPRAARLITPRLAEMHACVPISLSDNEIVLGSRKGMAIRFDETDVRAMGRSARGVRGMSLAASDKVVSMVAISPDMSLLTICENGYGKRTSLDQYRKTRRGGKGVINIKATDRNGEVVAIQAVSEGDELMFITAKGMMLRTDLSAVREIGRATQGVRLIRLNDDDKVVAVAKIAPEDEGEELETPDNEAPEPDAGNDAGDAS